MKRAIHFLLTFSCAIALCATASAQVQTTSAITGTVTDSSGAVMPGVKVTVRNEETGAVRETITNDAGHYSVQALRPGKYSITAALPGFKTAVVKDREVQVSIPAAVNFVLELGDVTQEITVSAEGQELINTTTGTLATTISENLVQNLPNQTRNFFDLVALSPNTSGQYFGNGGLSFGSHSMRRVNAAGSLESSGVFAAGSTDSATNVSIDGANIQMALYNMPVNIQSASTIKELRIETASANAEFGYGSNAINVITKNGTNNHHGEAFWHTATTISTRRISLRTLPGPPFRSTNGTSSAPHSVVRFLRISFITSGTTRGHGCGKTFRETLLYLRHRCARGSVSLPAITARSSPGPNASHLQSLRLRPGYRLEAAISG